VREFLHFISGEVPGGALLLFFIVLVINLALFYLYHNSKLFSFKVYRRKAIRSNIFVFGIYIILWIFLKPASLPERIIILPFQYEERADSRLSEALQRQLYGNLEQDFILHRWEWFYSVMNKDSLNFVEYRLNLAQKIGAAYIITGNIDEQDRDLQVDLRIYDGDELKQTSLTATDMAQAGFKVYEWMRKNMQVILPAPIKKDLIADPQLLMIADSKIALLEGDFGRVLKRYESPDSTQIDLVTYAYLQKGILEIEGQSDSPLNGIEMNLNFRRLFNLTIPYSKEGKDTADLNIILARMYMHHGNYGMAEICLKKAITQEKYNPRIYHAISFLHDSRYEELGFKNRAKALELAVQLDPGYKNAVYELAEEWYRSGTAAVTDPKTINAIKILRDYLKLNPVDENILALLGRILLQSKYTLEAMDIYTRLIALIPNSAEHHYNLGICYFHKKDNDTAKKEFNRAIEINDYPDAYLYLGAMYRLENDNDRALYYYRERVKRKISDDDQYAKEAMRGIRIILNDLAEQEEEANKTENSQ